MRMSEKCRNNNNSGNPLTSRRIDGGKTKDESNVYFTSIAGRMFKHELSILQATRTFS